MGDNITIGDSEGAKTEGTLSSTVNITAGEMIYLSRMEEEGPIEDHFIGSQGFFETSDS